jgi:hypothetical protein
MSSRIYRHIRTNVYGLVAIFIALGGTAYAIDGPLAGQNTVGAADIINDEVYSGDVRNDTLDGGGLGAQDLRSGSVGTSELLNGDIYSIDVANDTVASGGLTHMDLRADSVGTSELQDGSVQPADISANYDALVANDAFGRFHDAETAVPNGFSPTPTVLSRSLPAGSWLIFGKGHINFNGATSLSCELRAGADRDGMVDRANADGADALPGYGVVSLTVLHQSAFPFNAELACTDFGATDSAAISQMKIHAIEVQSITNSAG